MDENIVTGLFTLFGIMLGSFLTWIINYFKEKRDRKDRYFFALLDKRFEINQQAFHYAEKLKDVVHGEDDIRIKVVNDVINWFNQNNLYLEPHIRKKFKGTIQDVSFYNIRLQDYKDAGRAEGWETEKTKEKRKELLNTFGEIMEGLQKRIQEDVDLYYKYLK